MQPSRATELMRSRAFRCHSAVRSSRTATRATHCQLDVGLSTVLDIYNEEVPENSDQAVPAACLVVHTGCAEHSPLVAHKLVPALVE